MRSYPKTTARWAVTGVAVAAVLVSGCSRAHEKSAVTATTPASAEAAAPTSEPGALPPGPVPPGAIGLSPAGVTTRVDVPPDSTESQYGQACHAAKLWLNGQQGDPKTLVEPYLKTLQADTTTGPATFDTTWGQLTPAQQAGVIMAVNGAADGDCE
jgi:hypothetical protein